MLNFLMIPYNTPYCIECVSSEFESTVSDFTGFNSTILIGGPWYRSDPLIM